MQIITWGEILGFVKTAWGTIVRFGGVNFASGKRDAQEKRGEGECERKGFFITKFLKDKYRLTMQIIDSLNNIKKDWVSPGIACQQTSYCFNSVLCSDLSIIRFNVIRCNNFSFSF